MGVYKRYIAIECARLFANEFAPTEITRAYDLCLTLFNAHFRTPSTWAFSVFGGAHVFRGVIGFVQGGGERAVGVLIMGHHGHPDPVIIGLMLIVVGKVHRQRLALGSGEARVRPFGTLNIDIQFEFISPEALRKMAGGFIDGENQIADERTGMAVVAGAFITTDNVQWVRDLGEYRAGTPERHG